MNKVSLSDKRCIEPPVDEVVDYSGLVPEKTYEGREKLFQQLIKESKPFEVSQEYIDFWNLPEDMRGKAYEKLSSHDKFLVRISMNPLRDKSRE